MNIRIYALLLCLHITYLFRWSASSNILVFGGNGFIGSECVSQLLGKSHNITLVSRGSKNYDYEKRIKPHITHIKCDRYQGLSNCVELKHTAEKYDFIVDFSAYYPAVIEDALYYFEGKFDTYIYISTDSVYEVSQPSENEFSKESDAKRYLNVTIQKEVNERDSYGHYKLEGEEVLQRKNEESGLRFIVLRLPDVIGPRDTTFRWWAYQTLFQFYGNLNEPVLISKHIPKTSFVYVKDIGKALVSIVDAILNEQLQITNTAYNLAFPEALSLRQMLDFMQQTLGVRGIEYRYTDTAYYLYPSVTRGPIDISKVKDVLQWKATPWRVAINETIQFYEQALFDFPNEKNKMMSKLQMLVNPEAFALLEKELEKYIIKNGESQAHGEILRDEL